MSQLLSVEALAGSAEQDDILIVDTRFRLDDPGYGERAFVEGHIPGAVYMHLDRDLSSPAVPGHTGRHPLPEPAVLEARLREIGLRKSDQVVVYDDGPGMFAARLWWLLRWLGHKEVKVLNGGFAAWCNAGYPLSSDVSVRPWPGDFVVTPDDSCIVSAQEIQQDLERPKDTRHYQLIDARGPERFRGEQEPIDPVAGHIPDAVCLPCAMNVDEAGQFKSAAALSERFEALFSGQRELVSYCGSGVTACHNILAAVEAGVPEPRLYPGSWSEWITNSDRPVATA